MTGLAYARADDRLPMLRGTIDPAPLLHTWHSSDLAHQSLREITIRCPEGRLLVRVTAAGPAGPEDWGEVPARLYTDISSTGGGRATVPPVTADGPTPHYADTSVTEAGPACSATFERGPLRVRLQARINLGLLVVVILTERTGQGTGYFVRECFFR